MEQSLAAVVGWVERSETHHEGHWSFRWVSPALDPATAPPISTKPLWWASPALGPPYEEKPTGEPAVATSARPLVSDVPRIQ